MTTVNMYRELRDVWTRGFRVIRTDRQTYRHTHRNTLHPTRGEVKTLLHIQTKTAMLHVQIKSILNGSLVDCYLTTFSGWRLVGWV